MRAMCRMYRPITGTPFKQDETYREIAPCPALAPYIRCFWGSERPLPARPHGTEGLVIPDTCMDVIFHVDYVKNTCSSVFCALDGHSCRTPASQASGGLSAEFAIRFYAWTACLFTDAPLSGTVNSRFPVAQFFRRIEQALSPVLFEKQTLQGKAQATERVLLSMLRTDRADAAVLNAVHHMLRTSGRTRIGDVAAALALSNRQLERRFDAAMGVSPKELASLIRYQLLWQDMVLTAYDPLDAVVKFGYTDQAHLLHDFRSRHLMSPREALQFARRG